MRNPITAPAPPIAEFVLRGAIERALSEQGSSRLVTALRRRPSAYATSCALEEVVTHLDDGTALELMLKNLSSSAMNVRAARAKPAFLHDPAREIAVYRTILAPQGLGAALYAAAANPEADTYWLLIEKIPGRELYQVGDLEAWIAAARWLGRAHRQLARMDVGRLSRAAHLISYDRTFYRLWMDRAVRFLDDHGTTESPARRAALRWLADRHDRIVDRLLALPRTIIHGEFYPSNVLAAPVGADWHVWPVDWEVAAVGPGLIDVAALTLGKWREENRRTVVAAYVAAAGDSRLHTLPDALEAVECAQVQLAVQWLGWFGRRRPPAEHASDWLSDAVARAGRLGL